MQFLHSELFRVLQSSILIELDSPGMCRFPERAVSFSYMYKNNFLHKRWMQYYSIDTQYENRLNEHDS